MTAVVWKALGVLWDFAFLLVDILPLLFDMAVDLVATWPVLAVLRLLLTVDVDIVQWLRRELAFAHFCVHIGRDSVFFDPQAAFRALLCGCNLGHFLSFSIAGHMLARGEGVPRDAEHAFLLTQAAADLGFAPPCINLARMYANGCGTRKDMAKAVDYLETALSDERTWPFLAGLGNVAPEQRRQSCQAALEAGEIPEFHMVHDMIPFDDSSRPIMADLSKRWPCLIPQESDESSDEYSDESSDESVDDEDLKVLVKSITSLALLGVLEGVILDFQTKSTVPDWDSAEWSKAKKIVAEANKAKDAKRKFALLTKGAKLDYAPAMVQLGQMYENGEGMDKDMVKAAEMYAAATDLEDMDGRFNLAVCYELGAGVEKDEQEAVKLYVVGTFHGDVNAMNNLGVCFENGIGVEVNAETAVALYILAGKDGDGDAKFNLGECYENGVGVEKDLAKALALYKEAAAKGNEEAVEKVCELQC